jgi:GNAT superfamily N-acetyltransferase
VAASLRPLKIADLAAATTLQQQVYRPLYHEVCEVLASRVAVAPTCCLGAFREGELAAYILSHPWPAGEPPAIGVSLAAPSQGDNWFVHDLAISPQARGLGLGRALVAAAARAARDLGLTRGDLIAVQDAAPFWEKLGYVAPEALSEGLAAKVAAYGPDARYLTAMLADLKA